MDGHVSETGMGSAGGLPGFDALHQRADATGRPVPVAVMGAADRSVLEAFRVAIDRGWVDPLVVGPEAGYRSLAEASSIPLDGFRFVDLADPEAQAVASVLAVREGRARFVAKGHIATPALMHAVLDPERGIRVGRVVSQVVLMEVIRDARRFLLADTGISIKPKIGTRAEFARQVIEVARALGLDRPRVAMMAASESVNANMPETLDAAELARRAAEGEFGGVPIEGPLSFDLAYSLEAGSKKGIDGRVVGAADAMIFPDLLSANLTVKAIMYTADCRFGGVLRGTAVPVAFMSRADTPETRLNSLALALAIVARDDRTFA